MGGGWGGGWGGDREGDGEGLGGWRTHGEEEWKHTHARTHTIGEQAGCCDRGNSSYFVLGSWQTVRYS